MPSPTETKPPIEQEFDFLAFWIQHKSKVVLFAVLLLAGLVTFAIFEFSQYRARQAAAQAFATATSVEDFRKIADNHAGSPVAGNALLLLAERLRAENKFEESSQALQRFIDKHPNHPLISGAWTSLAVNLESQGKIEEALGNYQKVAASYPATFSAPAALMAQARIFKTQGKIDEAKRAYETVIAQFGGSMFARLAMQENRQLKK